MFVMFTQTYPFKSAAEVGKVAVKILAKPYSPYIKRLSLYATLGGDGVKTYALYEIEKGHVEEGIKELIKRYVPYYSIEGWKYTSETLLTVEEALATIGL